MSEINELIEKCKKVGMPQSTIQDGVKVIIIPLESTKKVERHFGESFDTIEQMKMDDSVNPVRLHANLKFNELLLRILDMKRMMKELKRELHVQMYGVKEDDQK
jgi:hypothetical protein